jgi:cytochrome oxidase Cu insertion factor (SCO1/SenC/PrrC family)
MRAKPIVLFLASLTLLISQDIYSQVRKLAPFIISLSDGSGFKAENLPIGKPVIIIYFSPDCEDCQKLTEGLLKRMDEFKTASIAMITYLPVENVKQFVAKYKLDAYPNIYVGTEGSTFIVRYYYNIVHFPFIVLHDRKGNLIKIYNKEENLDDLSDHLRNLQ